MNPRIPDLSDIAEALAQPIYNLTVWNAPDHEHTRYQVRRIVEEALAEAFALYEYFGGDAAQGLACPTCGCDPHGYRGPLCRYCDGTAE